MKLSTLAAALLLASPVMATDWEVHPGDNIQIFINLAQDGDRLLIHPGLYAGGLDLQGKQIEVIGVEGWEVTIVDGSSLTISCLTATSGESLNETMVAGLTFIGGNGVSEGGCVRVIGSELTIEACRLTGGGQKTGERSLLIMEKCAC